MKKKDMAEILNKCQIEESHLREAGQKEYAVEEDAFHNFNWVGDLIRVECEHCQKPTRIGRMAVLMVYKLKHIGGMLNFIAGHRSQREDVRGRINDDRVYSALLRGMIEEDAIDFSQATEPVLGLDSIKSFDLG